MTDKNTNPMPFNPQGMTVRAMLDAASTLRQIFDFALRDGITEEDIGTHVLGLLEHYQKHPPKQV